ncbi:hypothetical protein DVK05_13780 [Halorubrum sp. Atlit-8R]|uniref:hypothetical protein n=1 Tax=unclassified Halorubrum TaxID=2642239 RepID=UPI000EF24C18|nr:MULTISPECIES: hypothetical protein [unclassified Halorubrum]RLM63971.1 hypothetical protein DVK08_15525 [Halorubrum sp. Atlit-9R]RLM77348.1 hypothetical protein DVK05_13780 [Halorubrum sp. Atlit-8R]
MRNPWVHDDVPDDAGGGYDGPVRLLALLVWGSLALLVGGFVLLSSAGVVDLADGGSLGAVVTGVVAALALALALPVLLKLLAISRALALLAFLGTGATVGRFVIAREPEQFRALLDARDALAENADSIGGLFDVVDSMSPAAVDAGTAVVDAAVTALAAVPAA